MKGLKAEYCEDDQHAQSECSNSLLEDEFKLNDEGLDHKTKAPYRK